MTRISICSGCGKKFSVEVDDGVYDPTNCPQCDGEIINITNTPTSEESVAWISEE